VVVHDIKVNDVRAGIEYGVYFISQSGEVGGEA
jgi:hypothetical protein